MTSAEDRNDLVPAQEKLEWVTPKITLMGAEETEGKQTHTAESTRNVPNCVGGCWTVGPS